MSIADNPCPEARIDIELGEAIATSQRENRTVTVRATEISVSVDDVIDEVVAYDGYIDSVYIGDDVYDVWGDDWRLEVRP